MRTPISIPHTTRQYQVIFRERGGVANRCEYVEAETPDDAVTVARNYLASRTLPSATAAERELVGRTDHWRVVEVWDAETRETTLVRTYS